MSRRNKVLWWISWALVLPSALIVGSCPNPHNSEYGDETTNTVTVSPTGGEYTFPGGIVLTAPPGAVFEETNITIGKIENDRIRHLFENRGVSLDNLLTCVECQPTGMFFLHPVQLSIPVTLDPGTIPFVHEIDLARETYTPAAVEVLCDPLADTVTIWLQHFSAYSVEQMKEFEQLYEEYASEPCRSREIHIVQHDKDLISESGNCQITETELTVTFLDCSGDPTETSVVRELSAGCIPNLTMTVGHAIVPTGGQTTVMAQLKLGGIEPIEGQSVDFSISGPASVSPSYTVTDVDGRVETTFSAGDEEAVATVTARSTFSYYTYTISASGAGQTETINGPMVTKALKQSVDIEIRVPDQYWSGNATFTSSYANDNGPNRSYSYFDDLFWITGTPFHGERSGNIEFNIMAYYDVYKDWEFSGTAVMNQTVTMECNPDYKGDMLVYRNIVAPTLSLSVGGFANEIYGAFLTFETYHEEPLYTYEANVYDVEYGFEWPWVTKSIVGLINIPTFSEILEYPLKFVDGSYSGGYSTEDVDGNYDRFNWTVTWHKIDGPPPGDH